MLATGALVAVFRDDEVGLINGRTLSPDTHMTIYTNVVSSYIANAYSDRTPRIFAATTMQQDILDEVLVAYVLYRHLRCRSFLPGIVKKSASFLKRLFCFDLSFNLTLSYIHDTYAPARENGIHRRRDTRSGGDNGRRWRWSGDGR